MNSLIIDAASDKIIFAIVNDQRSYTTSHINCRENFDNFMKLILNFLDRKKISIDDINRIYVNLGPGKFTSLRLSLTIAKAITLANNAILVGFKSQDLVNKNYKKLVKLEKKKLSIKSLIKPIYSS
tara:strand:+ start:652 stop:1029 length:378 start_codon:yes stop_codon:yes gene_type:complete